MNQQAISVNDFSDVFISYRRVDVEFVKKLVQTLKDSGKEVWVDWEDIPPGSEGFADDIKRGLEGADAFIAVLSPDYLTSKYCVDFELSYALELNKKIIPLVLREFDNKSIPGGISHINWIYFTPHAGQMNTFEQSFERILQALELDFDHARTHKRLILRAIEWDSNGRKNSFLLSGDEIQQAETWITNAIGKDPQPTQIHQDYINASRFRADSLQRRLLAGVSGALIVALALATLAVFFGFQANRSANEAAINEANAISNYNLALTNEAQALINAETAVVAQSDALNQQSTAEFNAELALDNASTAEFNENLALGNAATAEFNEELALDNASTAEFNANLALDNAATAEFNEELALDNASTAEFNANLALDNAATAEFNEELALDNASTAEFNANLALDNAATAESARIIAENLERKSRAQTLAVFAQQALDAGEIDLSLALAIESGNINPSLLLAQRVLSQSAPLGVRLDLDTYEDNVTFYDTPIEKDEAYGGIFAFNVDGTLLAVANPNNDISIWNLDTRQQVTRLSGHNYHITDIIFSQNGQYLISSSSNMPQESTVGELFVWDLENEGQLRELEGHVQGITDIALHPNRSIIASVSEDQRAILWDYEIGFQLASYNDAHDSALWHVAWDLEGNTLYVSSETRTFIRLLGEGLETESLFAQNNVLFQGFSPQGQYAYSGGYQPASGRLTIWNTENGSLVREFGIQRFEPLEEYVRFVEFVPSNSINVLIYLERWGRLSGSELAYRGNKLAIWNITNNAELEVLDVDDDIRITALTYSHDGNYILTADNNGRSNTLTLRNAEDGLPIRHYFGHTAIVDRIEFSPDGNRAVSVDRDGGVRVWDVFLEDPAKINELNLGIPIIPTSNTRIPTLTTSGENIIAAQASYLIPVNSNTGEIGSQQYVSNPIQEIEFDMVHNRALIRFDTNRDYAPMDIWDVGGRRLTTMGSLDGDRFSDGVFLPDGSGVILVGKSQDDVGILVRYDLTDDPRNRNQVYRIEVDAQDISAELADIRYAAISRDGERLATVGIYVDRVNGPTEDEMIVIWDVSEGIALSQFRVDTIGTITDITFTPNGNSILTSLSRPDQMMIQWDIFSGEEQVQFVGHSDTVNIAIYNEDGTTVLSGSEDGTVVLWDAATGQAIRSYFGHTGSVTGVDFYNNQQSIVSISQGEILLWKIEQFQDAVLWVYNNRFVPEITCAQRLQYDVRPYCGAEENEQATQQPIIIETTPPTSEVDATPTMSSSSITNPTAISSPTTALIPTITPSPTQTLIPTVTTIDTGYQITSSEPVPIRVRPSDTAFTLPRTLETGEFVEIIDRQDDWLRVRLPDRTEGWIPANTVNNGDV